MKAPVGLLSDRTVLRQQDGGASPRQVPIYRVTKTIHPSADTKKAAAKKESKDEEAKPAKKTAKKDEEAKPAKKTAKKAAKEESAE